MEKLNCILLIDDNPLDNRYHRLLLEEMGVSNSIVSVENGLEALEFLKKENQVLPELIFLDINMPTMDGWEFMEAFKKLHIPKKSEIIVIMLSISANPKDISRSQDISEVSNFETKPLTKDSIENIMEHYF